MPTHNLCNITNNKNTGSRVWYITGVSQGLGLCFVRKALESGERVVGTTRTPDTDELNALVKMSKGAFSVVQCDITKEESVKQSIEHAIRHFGRLDVIVNNAGYGLLGAAEELQDDELRAHFDVNVFSIFHVIRHAMPHLRRQRSGVVFNISSIIGFNSVFPGNASYAATKFAMAGMSEAMAKECAPFNVKVVIVYPGTFKTNFFAGSYRRAHTPVPEYGTKEIESHCVSMQGQQRGDPDKAADVLFQTNWIKYKRILMT
eukprot:gene2360-2687_t